MGQSYRHILVRANAEAVADGLANVPAGRSGDRRDGGYVFAEGAHSDLCVALGLPQLCFGFRYLEMDFFLPDRPGLRTLFAAAIPVGGVEPIEPPAAVEGTAS